jgi:hypothetical protein
MTPFIVWHLPNFPPLATVYVTDIHWPNKPRKKILVRTKGAFRAYIATAKQAEREASRFQYEIVRHGRWQRGGLKSNDVATDQPTGVLTNVQPSKSVTYEPHHGPSQADHLAEPPPAEYSRYEDDNKPRQLNFFNENLPTRKSD